MFMPQGGDHRLRWGVDQKYNFGVEIPHRKANVLFCFKVPHWEYTGNLNDTKAGIFCSLRKQLTFCNATTGFRAKWWLRNEHRNSIPMTCHHPDLGSSSDWLKILCYLLRPALGEVDLSSLTKSVAGYFEKFTFFLSAEIWWSRKCQSKVQSKFASVLLQCHLWSPEFLFHSWTFFGRSIRPGMAWLVL